MASTDFNESNFDFSGEQSLVSNPLDANNAAHNHNSSSLLTSEIIFVDETVKDYQQLVAQIDADVYRLDSNLDGIEQITEVLSQYEDISGVHLISHGDEGSLKLGATELNQENLQEYGDRLKLWNNSLLDDADFLIYGCDVVAGEAGEDFVKDLGSLIGADIAASNDLTGNKDLGGDWDLEYATGEIEAEGIVSYDYQDVLATVSLDNGVLTYDSDGTITDTATDGTVSLIGYENDLDIYINNNELYIQEDNGFLFTLLDYPEAITAGANVTQVDDYTVKVDLSSVTGISLQTDEGEDSINLDSSFSGFTGSLNLDAGSVTDGDSVVINSDLFTAGSDLSIQAESITIPRNTTISTRQISGTDHLNDASTGNSGAIDFDARTLSLDGTNLYAHVLDDDTTNTAGNIDLHVKEEAISTVFGGFDTFDVDVSLDPVDVNVDIGFDSADDSTATLDLIGANLLGADITLDANASYDEDSFLSTIDNYSLFMGAAIVEATAKINIDSNSTIDATSLTANALTNTDAISTPVSLGIDIGIAYGSLDATAEVVIDGNVDVDGDLNLSTTSDNTIDVEADVGGYQNVAGAVAISEVNTTSRAQIGTTANIDVKGDLNIDADTIDQNYTLARSTTGEDGYVGIAASVSLENGSTEALLDSQNTTVAGNITLDADQSSGAVPKYTDYYTAGGVAAFANVGSDSTGDLVTDTQFGILGSVLNGAKGLKNLFSSKSDAVDEQTEGASSSFDLGAAVAYASDINNVTARIGDGAVVESTGGSIDLDATATNRPNVSAGSGVSGSGGSSSTSTTNENSEFAGSAAVAIGDYNNNTYAYIGDGATVDARQAIDIRAESLNDYETSWGMNLVSPFTDDSLEEDDRFPTFIANFASYLNDNLGLDNYVFDSWSQATAEDADIGIAGAVTWLDLNHISEAYIGDNAQINQDDTLRSDLQTVAVNAESINEAVHLGGNVQVPYGITGNFNSFLTIPKINDDNFSGTNNGSGVGGTVLVVNYDNDTKAKIGDGVKLYADSLEVDADTTAMSISLAASGGQAEDFGFNGTGTWFFVDNDTIAQIHSGADLTVKDKTVEGNTASLVVDATDKTDVINMSGGIAVSENIGIGASIGFNTIDRNTQALIGTLDDETAPTTKQKLTVDGDVDIHATNTGYIGSFALAAAVAGQETYEQPESTADYGSAMEQEASWGIGISGEASINKIADNTEAYISDIDIESSDTINIQPNIDLTAANTSEILTVGGSVAISLYDSDSSASAGIAGSFGKNTINNSTKAYTENSAVNGGNLTILADNNVDIISVNASGSGDFNDKGYALAGSVAINEINNDTLAYLSNSDITATAIDIDAQDNSTIAAVAGSLAYGGRGGIGASVAINAIGDLEGADNNTTKAYVSNSDLDVDSLDITGTNDSEITSVAVSVGLAKDSMAGSFSITYNRINNDTEAYLLNSGTQTVDVAGDINILAQDNSQIYAHAYPVSASFSGSAVGLALAINEVTNNTISYVDNATVNAENLTVKATDDRIVQSIAVGGAIANSYGISGSISVVEIGTEDKDNQTSAYIGSGAVVTTQNNLVLSAEDNSEVFSLGGNVNYGNSGAIGVANSTLSTHNKVKAYVEGGANVSAFGLVSDATVLTGIVDTDFQPEEDKIRGLAISAVSTRSLQNYAVSGSISAGNLAVAASASITLLDETTEAYIGDGAKVNSNNNSAGNNQGVYVRAGNYTKLIGAGGGVSGSSSMGIGAGGDGSVLAHTTKAYIGDAAEVNTEKEVLVNAYANQDIQSYAASGAFGGNLGVAGSASYIGIENATSAYIDDNAIVTSQGNILVYAEDTTDADPFAGNLAAGGIAGIGVSVGIIDLQKDTQAFLGNNAQVNALANHSGTLDVYDTADNDSGYSTVTGFRGLAVNAYSSEDIDTIAVGGSAAGTFGFAGSLTYSEIDSDTLAYTGTNTKINQQSGGKSWQDVNITAVNDLDLYALDGAATVGGTGTIAGAVDIANIHNGTEAFIGGGSVVDAESDVKVNALNDKTLETLVVSGSAAGTAALGGSVTVYNIGGTLSSSYEKDGEISDALEQEGNTAQESIQDAVDSLGINKTMFANFDTDITTAYIGAGAQVTAGDNLAVNARENLVLDSILGQATGAGTVAVGGSIAVVEIDVTTSATISDSATVDTGNNITIDAEFINDTDVTALAGQVSGFASIGGAVAVVNDNSDTTASSLGTIDNVNNLTINANSDRNINAITGNASLSLVSAAGASVGVVEIGGSTNAYLGGTVVDASNIDVLANNQETIDIYTLAISGGIASDTSGSVANGTADSQTNAYITSSAKIGTTGTVGTIDVAATYTPEIITFAEGYGGSGGLTVGASDAYGIIKSDTKAYIGNKAAIEANNFNLIAEQQLPTDGLAIEADATASGGALGSAVNAATATTKDESTVNTNINTNADLDIANTIALTATLISDRDAFADGYNGGIVALGFNYAFAESDTENKINLAEGADINAANLSIAVDGAENNYAEAIAGGGGIVSGRAAEAITDSISDTQANINSDITVDILDIQAEHTADFNSKVDSVNASVVGGSGAYNENTVTADIAVNFNSKAEVKAEGDFDVAINNNIEQTALGDENAEAGSGGFTDGSAVETVTTIENSSTINVNDGAVLAAGDEDYDTIDNLDFAIVNDVSATAKSKLNSGGAISKAKAEAEVTNDINEAIINIGDADITSTHDINFSTRAIADLEADAKASAWGISGVSQGDSLTEATIDNEINLNSGASVTAEQDVNFYVGEDSNGDENDIDVAAYTNLWNNSASPMSKGDIESDSNLTLNNTINIADDKSNNNPTELLSNENINLVTNDDDSTYNVVAEGEGTDAYSQVASTLASLVGAKVSSVLTNSSTSDTFTNGINVDGSLIAGQNNQQHLTINQTGGNYSFDKSDQIETDPTIATEDVTASIDETIDSLETERSQYENSSDDGEVALYLTLSAEIEFWENEKAKIGDGNVTVIDLPNISASAGSISLAGGYLTGTGNIEAKGDAAIDITNNTDAYLRVNDVSINDNYGGELFFNNAAITSNDDLDNPEDFTSIVTGNDLDVPAINILNDSDSILEVKGSLINRNGDISITNTSGSIYVTDGEISAQNIDIDSGESFFLSDGDLYSVDNSPESLWSEEFKDDGFMGDSEEDLTYDNASNAIKYGTTSSFLREDSISNPGDVNSKLSENNESSDGGIDAESSIFLAAEYINVSGNLKSGVDNYDLTIDSTVKTTIDGYDSAYANANNQSNIDFSSEYDLTNALSNASGKNISGYYNPETNTIVIDDLQIQGGYIQLVGNVLSTGNGNIEVMDGFGDISIDNSYNYNIQLNALDTGGEGAEGKIVIIDNGSGTPVVTTYTKDDTGVVKTVDGVEVTDDTDIYSPQETHSYNWYYQRQQTIELTPARGSESIWEVPIPDDYEIYGDSLYFLTSGNLWWYDAQSLAQLYGGDLVTINNAAENAWINKTFSSDDNELWLGLTDNEGYGGSEAGSSKTNGWVWQSGESLSYTNWESDEPNNKSNEDYVEMRSTGLWNDLDPDPSSDNYGVIEIPLDSVEFEIATDNGEFKITDNYTTNNPETYVYEPTSSSTTNSQFNFTSAVDEPSFKSVLYDQGDLQIDGNTITVDVSSHFVGAVPSQYDIEIDFFGSDTATLDVTSTQDITLTGDVINQAGDIDITSTSGSILATSDLEIATDNLAINAANGSIGDSDNAIKTNLDGGTIEATATGDVYLDETTGDITVDTVTTDGNVSIEAYGNLEVDSSSSKITGQEISLTSETGNIGSDSLDVKIDSGSSETGSVTLDAAKDINVTETTEDLYLVSADANNGDVNISVNNGNLIDYNPEETEDLAARAELLDTTWSEMELTDEDITTTEDVNEENAASTLAAETVTAYEQSKEAEYELYWQYRNLTLVYDDDGNFTGYTYDDYDADYTYSFDDATRANLEELGYSDSAIAEQEAAKTEQYHNLHAELEPSGLTDDYDSDYSYTATAEEEAEISEGAVWTVDELTRVVNPDLLLPVSDTEIDIEADNIQADNLTLDVGGGIGKNEGIETITVRNNSGEILGINDEDLLYLLSAESKDITYLDNAGNEVADVSLNVDSVYSIEIAQIDDLDFDATGELNVTATADTYLGSEGDITINDLDVGANEIRLKSGNGITGTASSSNHITADNIVIEAGDSSIGSETTPVEIETNTITARGNNDIYINQASGDLAIEQIYSGDNVDLTVVGKVSDANNTDDENIRSIDIAIDSSNNDSLGSSDNYLDVYVESDGTYEVDTSQDAYILNTNSAGAIAIDLAGTSGTLGYSDGIYTVTDSSSGTSVNFAGFEAIALNFASQNNSFTVESLASDTTLNLTGDSGNDTIELSNTLEGTVTIDGGTGSNTLILNDADDTAANSYNIGETKITGHINNAITYGNIDKIEVQSGSNSNDALTVTNETDTTRTITADNSTITNDSFADITHSGIEAIDYYAESGSNSLDVTSFTDTGISLTVYSNLGDDTNTLDLDAPTNQANIVVAVDENASTLKVADLNHSSNSFTLSGTDADKFEILNNNELHFSSTPDFETQSSYELTVIADGTDNIEFNISITDINEAPSLSLDNSTLTLTEDTDTSSAIKIGDITISDDALGDNVLSLSGDDADLFEIVNDTELYLVAETELDYETNPDLDVTITVDDGTFSIPLDITVAITDINEAPSIDYDYVDVNENQVLVLDGDGDYVETNRDVIDLSSADFTLEAWIQTSETNQGIIGKGDDDFNWETKEKAFYIDDSGKVRFTGSGNNAIAGSTPVNDGAWHHVMVVWDATNTQGNIYVDGTLDTASDNYYIRNDNTDDTLKLGLAIGDSYFSGKLDRVAIWDKALTYEEIQTNLATTLTGTEDNIVAFYNFENDSTTEAVDVSGTYSDNSYYGRIEGDAYKESDRTILTVAEDTDTTSRVKLADLSVSDDALGTNNLTLSGDDASLFEIDGTELYLAAGATLDYETNPILDVTVEVDDDTIGSTPDNIAKLRIVVGDNNDAPVINIESGRDSLAENTDTTSRVQVADLSISDADAINTDYTLSLSGKDADVFELDGTELYLVAGTTLDYETDPDLNVIVRLDDPTIGDTFDDSVGINLDVTNSNEIFTLDDNDINQTLALDGDGDYANTNAEVIDLSESSFTIEAWIKTSGTSETIISQDDGDFSEEAGEKSFYIDYQGKLIFEGDNSRIYGATAVNDGEWHHVAAVWDKDGSEVYMYLDGVDDTNRSNDRSSYSSVQTNGDGNTLKIGSSDSNRQYYSDFSGEIDDVRIWDKALSAADISENFNRTSTFTGEEDNLVAYYDFQTGSIDSTTASDESGNGYDLVLVDDARTAIASELNIDNSNGVIMLSENSADDASVKIADITMIDDNYTIDDLILTGDDADKFSISGTELWLNSGTPLDYETDKEYDFEIAFDSETVEAAEEISVNAIDILELVDIVTELDENTDTTERIKVAELNLSEAALNSNSVTLSGDSAEYFEVEDFALYLKAGTVLNYEDRSTHNVTVTVDDVVGSTIDTAVDFSLAINDVNDAPTDLELTTNSTNLSDNLFLSGDSNYIETNAGITDFSQDFTIEAWIQTTASNQGIVIKNDNDDSWETKEKSFYISSTGKLVLLGNGYATSYGKTSVNDGKLHHVAVVNDASKNEVYFYVDGQLDVQTRSIGSFSDKSSDTVKIGTLNYFDGSNDYFDGLLGDIRIWDTARSQSEILANLSETLTGTETGLVANYNNFNSDYTNTTITDATGNYNGTLIGYDSSLNRIALPENIDTTARIKLAEFSYAEEDAVDTNQVTIVGDDSDKFELVATGDKSYELYLAAGVELDFETNSELNINLEISDLDLDDEAIISQSFTVVVADENEVASLTVENVTVTELDEDTATNRRIKVANLNIVDEDDNDRLNLLTLSGDDASSFTINNNKLYLKAGATLDYETNPQLDVTVELDDPSFGTGIEDSVDFSIAINDANDAATLDVTLDSSLTENALTFDGGRYTDADFAEIDSDAIDLGAEYTFETWLKTTSGSNGIFAKRNDDRWVRHGEKSLFLTSGRLMFGSHNGFRDYFLGNTRINDGEWHHVALVSDGSTVSMYLDGEAEAQGSRNSFTYEDNAADSFWLGSTWNNGSSFDGEMRDVRFWNTARTQTEIQHDLDTQLTGTEAGLVAYYDFTGGSDTAIVDRTGNGNDGTLVDDTSIIEVTIFPENLDTTNRIKIADFSVSEVDTDAAFIYNASLGGSDSELFEIDGTEVYLKAGTTLDIDAQATYDLTLEIEDGIYSDSFVFDIGVTAINEAPSMNFEGLEISLAEDTETNNAIKVADFNFTDDSESQDITLTGDDAELFEVVDIDSDVYSFALNIDYDSNTPNFDVALTDSSFTTDTSSAIKVADLSITDGADITGFTLSGDDADKFEVINDTELYLQAGTTIDSDTSFSVTVEASGTNSETASLALSLNELDGKFKELYLKNDASLDYETNPQLDVTVEVSDGEFSESASYSLAVTDVDEAPIVTLENTIASLEENTDTTSRIKIADIVVTDDDSNDNNITLTSIGSTVVGEDTDYQNFELDGTELYLKAGTTLDFEVQNKYEFNIEVSDSTHTTTVDYEFKVTNVIENPVDLSFVASIQDGEHWSDPDAVISVNRDTTERFKVADLVIDGGEGNETFSHSGFYADDFEIDGNELYVKAGADTSKYSENEGYVDILISVDNSDTSKYIEFVFFSGELEIGNYDLGDYFENNSSKDFGSVSVASGTIEYEFELFNYGYDSLEIEDVTITGANSDDFQILRDVTTGSSPFSSLGETPTTLASDDGALITVEFDPSSGGDLSAALEITSSDASDNLYIVNFTGTGIGSEINIAQSETEFTSGDTQDFGILEIDTETSQRTFTITNTGSEALSISDIAITGDNADDFTTSSISEIAVGESADITVSFTPTAGGDRSATLIINNNDDDEGTYTINLTGNGAIPEIDLVQEDTALPSGTTQDFGSVNVDSGELQQTITIQNNGSKTLNLGDIEVTGTNATYFTLENGYAIANTALEPGDSTNLTITFNPRSTETATATLTINSDDSDEAAYTINLTGTGTESTEVTGSDNNDVIENDDDNQVVDAGAGDDIVTGNDSGERVTGGDGADQIYSDEGNDRNYGDAGDDVIIGGAGRDFLRGGADNDIMFGGDDNDYLIGDDGEDYLDGEAGSDRLRGGSDSDTFVLRSGDGTDLIIDFNVDEDHFELDGLEVSDLTLEDDGSFASIDSGDETLVKVRNVTASQLEDYFTNRYSS